MTRTVCPALTLVLFLMMVAASCGTSAETDSTPWDDNVDGLQACTDTCTLKAERCQESTDCAVFCADMFKNSGPECTDELTAQWACMVYYYKDMGPECQEWPTIECDDPKEVADRCAAQYGCTTRNWWSSYYPPYHDARCKSGLIGPNQEQGCTCSQSCNGTDYYSKCWMQGTTSFCECHGDSVTLGTCEGGPEPFCDPNVYNGCCNQYFMIEL